MTNTSRRPPTLPRFPTMLRKMWTGAEVQRWIDTNAVRVPAVDQFRETYIQGSEDGQKLGLFFAYAQVHEAVEDVRRIHGLYAQKLAEGSQDPDHRETVRALGEAVAAFEKLEAKAPPGAGDAAALFRTAPGSGERPAETGSGE